MKSVNFLLILILGVFFTACNKEDRVCVKADFIGDFPGTTTCKSINGATGQPVATLIRITDSAAENEVNVDVDGFKITVVIDGCNLSGSDVNADVDLTFTGSLNGENIEVKLEGRAFGAAIDCETRGEKN